MIKNIRSNFLPALAALLSIAMGLSLAFWIAARFSPSAGAASIASISGVVKDDAGKPLRGAMISTSSSAWQSGTQQWSDDFNALKGNLQNIADQLNQQIRQMQANEANNVALANSVTSVSMGSALL